MLSSSPVGGPAAGHPASARAFVRLDHERLLAGDRCRGDHRHDPQRARADDARQRRPRALNPSRCRARSAGCCRSRRERQPARIASSSPLVLRTGSPRLASAFGRKHERSDLLEAVVARSTHIQVYVQMHHDASANLAHRGLSLRVTERSSQPAESARCWLSSPARGQAGSIQPTAYLDTGWSVLCFGWPAARGATRARLPMLFDTEGRPPPGGYAAPGARLHRIPKERPALTPMQLAPPPRSATKGSGGGCPGSERRGLIGGDCERGLRGHRSRR